MEHYQEQLTSGQGLAVTKILSLGWEIFRTNFATIMFFALLISVPSFILEETFKDYHYLSLVAIVWMILCFVLYILGACALIQLSAGVVYGKSFEWADIFSAMRAKSHIAAITSSLALLICLLLGLLLIIPGIIWAIYYSFIIEAVMLRDLRGMEALGYSKKLVQGYWWSLLGVILLTAVVGGLSIHLVNTLIAFIFSNSLISPIIALLLDTAMQGFIQVVTLLVFLRLEYIKGLAPDATSQEVIDPAQ